MTAPVSAHLLCKAALHMNVDVVSGGYEPVADAAAAAPDRPPA
jgi:multisubunit Na+/H+ antiporter MnhG subunit